MRRLVLPPAARRDLTDIYAYIVRRDGSRSMARRSVGLLTHRGVTLAALPGTLGRSRPELGGDVRSVATHGYVIIFKYEPGLLRILRVIEGHRDIPAHVTPAP